MKFELNSLPYNCSDEEIIVEIRRIDTIVNKDFLTKKDYDEHGKISSSSIQKRLGSWQKALIVAGLGHKYFGPSVTDKMIEQKTKFLKDEEIICELQRIAKLLNKKFLTFDDIKYNSAVMGPTAVIYRFGSWANGIKKAGLEISQSGHRYSDDECFENLLNVWTHYGRQPKHDEIKKPPSVISPGTYERRFGTWRKALEAFIERMNKNDNRDEQVFQKEGPEQIRNGIQVHNVAVEEKHVVGLGLRYKVLSRDNFRCVRCGRSPATSPGVELHVDHKQPFSKQGKTIIENLETKCRECNLGKSNRHIE